MLEYLTALFLGFIEGLTEFIPVSSTAHLIVLTDWLGLPLPPGHVFEVFIQLGAIFAVIVLYHKKLWHTAIGFFLNPKDRPQDRLFAFNLIAGTVPALVIGTIAHDWIKEHLYNPFVISIALVIGGIAILFLERRLHKPKIESLDNIPLKTAFLVGCCQTLALVPGVSRSGATIMGALLLGLARPAAAEFSFFLAIPVMFAAVGYDTLKNWHSIVSSDLPGLLVTGFLGAFVTALCVIKIAMKIISRHGFVPFAWYRLGAGACIFAAAMILHNG